MVVLIGLIEEQERKKNIQNKISTIEGQKKVDAFVIRRIGKNNDKRKVKFKVIRHILFDRNTLEKPTRKGKLK